MTSSVKPGTEAARSASAPAPASSGGYRTYVLVVLTIVYVFNFIDRQILSILAEDIKKDLGLADAQIGFLYGTAFAVFYAIFGIPLGRLADVWVRKSLISVGLFFWSLMTALSGTARGFGTLAGFRIGVGVGESSASPAAFSMLGDYFPPRMRATAVAIYSSGVYIGAGVGLFLGGLIVGNWNERYANGGAPFGLAGWQAAFFAVGIPGLIMALWVRTLREPVRGQSEGLVVEASKANPVRELLRELGAVLPPLTLLTLARAGAGVRGIAINLAIAAACAGGAAALISVLGSAPQWIALAIGLYAFFSWLQGVALRDRATFSMIYKSKAVVFGEIGFACIAFVGYGFNFWTPPFFQREHGVSVAQAGVILGLSGAIAGWLGVSGGGILSDRL
jgi:MFS family permease